MGDLVIDMEFLLAGIKNRGYSLKKFPYGLALYLVVRFAARRRGHE
jgi:hypothetical protein